MQTVAQWLAEHRVERLADDLVLERGRAYQRRRRCVALDERDDGAIAARVLGTGRTYHVSVRVGATGLDASCTCPYWLPICKHVVCALLTYRAELVDAGRLGRDPEAGGAIGPQTPQDALYAWAERHGVTRWLVASVAVVADLGAPRSPALEFERRRNLPIAEFFGPESRWSHIPRAFVEDLVAFLGERAARARTWRAEAPALTWPEPPAALAPTVAGLRALRDGLLAQGAFPLAPELRGLASVRLDHDAWPLVLDLVVPARPSAICPTGANTWGGARVRVALDPPARPRLLGDGLTPRALEAEALEAALDHLCRPEHAAFAEAVGAALTRPRWERLLGALRDAVRAVDTPLTHGDEPGELGWRVTAARHQLQVTPLFVRPRKSGPGVVTRKLALATLTATPRRWPEPADALVIDELSVGDARCHLRAVRHLVGHPRVFLDAPGTPPVAVRASALTHAAWVAAAGEGLEARPHLGFELDGAPLPLDEAQALIGSGRAPVAVVADAARGELRVVSIPPEAEGLAAALARFGEALPDEAVPTLVDYLTEASAQVTVRVPESLAGERVAADGALLLQLEAPADAPVVARLVVRPLPERASETPGEGPERLIARRGDGVVHCLRDLEGERSAALASAEALGLDGALGAVDGFSWRLDAVDDVLDVVNRAREAEVPVLWATPTRYAVGRRIQGADLVVRAEGGAGRDWFGLDGEVRIDGAVLPLRELLRALRERRRYVRIGDGAWAALDAALRRRLEAIAATMSGDKVSLLAAPAVEELAEVGVSVSGAGPWLDRVTRAREARDLAVALPDGLTAELRGYQREGFTWLARLAHWGTGACLADDMGLGKTVQALALMLRRADEGPQLVVAPTSLGFNWQREADRFAPSLTLVPFRGAGQVALLEGELGPGEVVVTSYDLVARYADAFKRRRWRTVVLDEAQAIKNPDTLRARAVFGLGADFVAALTGTPIENRTGELWSLFRAIAPGLLGSRKAFREGFAVPIERFGDPRARQALAAVVRPFVLRRLKREVARELPPRTDVRLDVELSAAERALYDEVRGAAVASLAGVDGAEPASRFLALQALTRLRQLACDPRLLDPGSEVASSKLEVVRELVSELRDEGHKALIFSQFTSLLALVRQALEADGVSCRYLDGSTPAAMRREEVDAFQAGEGDVFLLSLKAGGTGLNLTAADYVLHLDPWWNPAVEDQATDRAHRIGQDKPVTVYRLVAQGTVEEGIMALHEERRELAEALLAGTDSARALSVDELAALIRGAHAPRPQRDEPGAPPRARIHFRPVE